MSMSTAELETFLAQTFPTPLGVIATLRHDGSPHIVPVWFRWDAGVVTIWTTRTRAWVRNLLHDPRVAFSVQTFEEPYPAVMMRGPRPSRLPMTPPRSSLGGRLRRSPYLCGARSAVPLGCRE